jgi:hypothetical protein
MCWSMAGELTSVWFNFKYDKDAGIDSPTGSNGWWMGIRDSDW